MWERGLAREGIILAERGEEEWNDVVKGEGEGQEGGGGGEECLSKITTNGGR